ncbi:unnamed protein product [Tenebrio molitor]|nr:unnamed protein product [Tenebrio molitor]
MSTRQTRQICLFDPVQSRSDKHPSLVVVHLAKATMLYYVLLLKE